MITWYDSATIDSPLFVENECGVCPSTNEYQAAMTLRYKSSLSNQYALQPRRKMGRKPEEVFRNLGQVERLDQDHDLD